MSRCLLLLRWLWVCGQRASVVQAQRHIHSLLAEPAGDAATPDRHWRPVCQRLMRARMVIKGDPFGDLGRLRDELFRGVRLVVDTGIHAKRWTREQAIAYMLEKTGMGEKDVTAEIERYIVNPGQACAYKIGMLKIQELRKRAQEQLGDKFDQREFHDTLLKNGALPLEILEEQVDGYVKAKRP